MLCFSLSSRSWHRIPDFTGHRIPDRQTEAQLCSGHMASKGVSGVAHTSPLGRSLNVWWLCPWPPPNVPSCWPQLTRQGIGAGPKASRVLRSPVKRWLDKLMWILLHKRMEEWWKQRERAGAPRHSAKGREVQRDTIFQASDRSVHDLWGWGTGRGEDRGQDGLAGRHSKIRLQLAPTKH